MPAGGLRLAHPVDLLVSDRLPGVESAGELLIEVRERFPEMPLILLTEQEASQYADLQGALGQRLRVIAKPWDVESLKGGVLEALGSAVEEAEQVDLQIEEDELLEHVQIPPERLKRARRIQSRMETPIPLGQVLVQLGEIDPETLEQAQRASQSGQDLIDILRHEGHLTAELWQTDVSIDAVLDQVEMPLGEVLGWIEGSQLALNCNPNSKVELRCGDVSMFKGRMGRRTGNIAIQVSDKIVREGET